MADPVPKLQTVFRHGMRRCCPRCGKGPVYAGWIRMHDKCSSCGLNYLQDQGDLWIYIVAFDRAMFILPLIAMIYFRLYNPNSIFFILFCVALLSAFVYTSPHRNAVGLGLDYYLRCRFGDLSKEATPEPDKVPPK